VKYILTLKKKLFKDYSTFVTIYRDSTISFNLDYKNVSGILGSMYIDSSPRGAEIFLNGISTWKKTQSIIEKLFPGTYNVKFKLTGYWDDSLLVDVKSGATVYPYITLHDTLIWANFNTTTSKIPDDYINHIAIERGWIKWVATLSGGLVRFDDKIWTIYNASNSPLPTNNIKYIGIDNQNRKWICASSELLVFDDVSWTVYNSSNSLLPDNDITCITFETNNCAWIGTYGGGAARFDGISWTVFNKANSDLQSDFITTIAVDKNNNKWVGTHNEGVAKYNDNHWSIYNSYKSGVEKNANHIAIDLNNTPWVAISSIHLLPGGSAYFDGMKWLASISVPSSNVLFVDVDRNNQKWFGNSENGLSKFSNNTWTHFTTSNSRLPNDRVFAIAFDGAGNKWIATFGGGLSKYKGD
jgi:ligand-binding sensor domain-containing protein